MTQKTSTSPATNLPRRSVAWPPFTQKLATVLATLEEDQYLVLSVKGSNRFVQFAGQGSFGMRVETTSNSYLAKSEKLNKRQIAALLDAGWEKPTNRPRASTPERDPDGSPNFFIEIAVPVPFEAAAHLTVNTLAEILRVPYPGALEYKAFERDGKLMALPQLGLKHAKSEPDIDQMRKLPELLLTTIKAETGVEDLVWDSDGSICLRYGSAQVTVRPSDNHRYVRFYSWLLLDIESSDCVLNMLNELNASEPLVCFVLRGNTIIAVADICASPFVPEHLIQAFTHFCETVDRMGSLLQTEFGGHTAFLDEMPSTLTH